MAETTKTSIITQCTV